MVGERRQGGVAAVGESPTVIWVDVRGKPSPRSQAASSARERGSPRQRQSKLKRGSMECTFIEASHGVKVFRPAYSALPSSLAVFVDKELRPRRQWCRNGRWSAERTRDSQLVMDSETSWKPWFERHSPALLLFARQWAGSEAAAEDAVKEAFVCFWRTRDSVSAPLPYLFSSVKRCALEARRGDARRRRREMEAQPRAFSERRPWFVARLERAERGAAIEAALSTLPAEQREVLILKIWSELTFAEIGETLEISLNTAASRYRYAIECLRSKLAREARHDV